MTGNIDPAGIDCLLPLERGKHDVKELEIAVQVITGTGLPASLPALWIRQPACRRKPLRINAHRFRPRGMQGKKACGMSTGASVAVKYKHQRFGAPMGIGVGGRCHDQGLTGDSLNLPTPGQERRSDRAAKKREKKNPAKEPTKSKRLHSLDDAAPDQHVTSQKPRLTPRSRFWPNCGACPHPGRGRRRRGRRTVGAG